MGQISTKEFLTKAGKSFQVRTAEPRNTAGAIQLYRKLGFQEEGVQVKDLCYGKDHYIDTVLMAKFVKD